MRTASRRRVLAVLAGSLGLGAVTKPAAAVTSRRTQTTIDLVGANPLGLVGWAGVSYNFPGAAASASGKMMQFGQGLAPVAYARWVLVWNPIAPTSGVRLIRAGYDGDGVVEIAKFESNTATGPIASAFDLTEAFNGLVELAQMKFLATQEKGNGSVGPLVFGSWLEIVWDLA